MNDERRRELRRARTIRRAVGALLVTVPGAVGAGPGLALLLGWPRRRTDGPAAARTMALPAGAIAVSAYAMVGLSEAFGGSAGEMLAALGAAVIGLGAVVALATVLGRRVELEAVRVVAAVGVWALPDLVTTIGVPPAAVVAALPLVALGWALALAGLDERRERPARGPSPRRAASSLELRPWTDRRR
ncbi:MAG: hypothetical protein S0880_24220 [Actinomycetota bacterium]|nr:hypothetical protein [Actinomycetota bacterium]